MTTATTTAPALLRNDEAAKYLNLSPRTMPALRSKGRGPRFHKLGKRVLYDVADLDAWLASCARETAESAAAAAAE